jgi:hypothetical protein
MAPTFFRATCVSSRLTRGLILCSQFPAGGELHQPKGDTTQAVALRPSYPCESKLRRVVPDPESARLALSSLLRGSAMSRSELARKLEEHREDFRSIVGTGFDHFFCPILHIDEYAKLCKGHIVGQAFPNSARDWVVQRKDVEDFYGSRLLGSSGDTYSISSGWGRASAFGGVRGTHTLSLRGGAGLPLSEHTPEHAFDVSDEGLVAHGTPGSCMSPNHRVFAI